MGAFSVRTRAGIYGIISAMGNCGAKIKVPTTGVFDFPSLILGGKGKYVDKTELLYQIDMPIIEKECKV